MPDRLLVVDSVDEVRSAYLSHFSRAGFDVHSAGDLQQGAERLTGESFDAVIADVCSEPAVGLERLVAALARTKGHTPPVVVLTAYGEPARARAAARLRVDLFLHKPVSLVWLEGLIRSLVRRKRRERSGDHPPTAG